MWGEAGDGIELIEKVRQRRPDIVLMDVNMPRINGLEATGDGKMQEETCARYDERALVPAVLITIT